MILSLHSICKWNSVYYLSESISINVKENCVENNCRDNDCNAKNAH